MASHNIEKSIKATSLFGGIQIFGIIISLIKNKFVALFIGPFGIGLVELYNSTINLIQSFTDFSLSISAVRDISASYKDDKSKFVRTTTIFSKIVWFTGLLGLLVCFLGSPLWSKFAFGNYDYTIAFAALSVILLFNQLTNGKSVILQGTENYKYLAFSGLWGNLLGLITTIPIYYILREKGIVLVLVISSATAYLLARFYISKLKIQYCKLGRKDIIKAGGLMLKQGFYLSLNFLLSILIYYLLRVFITNQGGVAVLGLFSASYSIISSYVGLVFQAMSKEYYPRLSSLASNIKEFNLAINDQLFFSLLVIAPLVFVFLTFSAQLISILYSNEFSDASLLMALSMIGVIFQAPTWCMGFALLAKGDNKLFLVYESILKILKISLDIILFLIFGLNGLGISFITCYFLSTLLYLYVCGNRYGFKLYRKTRYIIIISSLISGVLLYFSLSFEFTYRYLFSIIIIIVSCILAFREINKYINIMQFIKRLRIYGKR